MVILPLSGCMKGLRSSDYGAPIIHDGQRTTQANSFQGQKAFYGKNTKATNAASRKIAFDANSQSDGKTVYFGFDQSSIEGQAQKIVDQNVDYLLAHPQEKVLVAGHTDPRGSNNYNLHLAQRRADSVKSYMLDHGVTADQVCTVSYGDQKPAATPNDFGGDWVKAYTLDRRAVFSYGATCNTGAA